MEIHFSKKDDVTIVNVKGRIDIVTSNQLSLRCGELFGKGEYNVIINLADVDYISSSGLRQFLMIGKEIDSANGKFGICSLNGMVKEVFTMSGVDSLINVYPDEAEALQAVSCN